MRLQKTDIEQARRKTPWDLSNRVLYDLCKKYPQHKREGEVLAKVLLIGRVYAAAIERRRNKAEKNDAFYTRIVAPEIIGSDIDAWIARARQVLPNTAEGTLAILDIHSNVTALFNRISKQDKRSLASKYLHFHVPHLFFILDSRALRGMSKVASIVGRASRSKGYGDNEYRKFIEKCLSLKAHCRKEFELDLNPRQLDNLLLWLALR